VLGDIVADVYVLGHPERLSREAPVMVVRFEDEHLIPGCAANTMNNLLCLGCRVLPLSVMGEDDYGRRLRQYFVEKQVPMDSVIFRPDFQTVSKTRIMVGEPYRTKQQVIRVDRELQGEPPPGLEDEILSAMKRADPQVDAWLVSDYDYFMVTPRIADALVGLCRKKPLIVDSRFRSIFFKGARCFTPNESEAMNAAGIKDATEKEMEHIGWELLKKFEAGSLVITRGNQGMLIFEEAGQLTSIPAVGGDEGVDVTGAGDTVAATMTAALVAGATTTEAARLASLASGIVVMKSGAATCSPEELRDGFHLLDPQDG
jgi:rfaE bifunctional protein kinase chain/domain